VTPASQGGCQGEIVLPGHVSQGTDREENTNRVCYKKVNFARVLKDVLSQSFRY
jgi:hypothetical protein